MESEPQDILSMQGLMLDPATGAAVPLAPRPADYWLQQYQNAHRQITERIGHGGYTPEQARQELWAMRSSILNQNPSMAAELAAAIPDPATEVLQNDRPGNAQGYTDQGLMNNRVGATQNARFRIQQNGYVLDNQTGAVFSNLTQMHPDLKAAYDAEQKALGLTSPGVPGSPSSSTPPGSSPPGALNTLNPGGAPVGTQAPTPYVAPTVQQPAAAVAPTVPPPAPAAPTVAPTVPAAPPPPPPPAWAAPTVAEARIPISRLGAPSAPQPVTSDMGALDLFLNMTGRGGAGAVAPTVAPSGMRAPTVGGGGAFAPQVEPRPEFAAPQVMPQNQREFAPAVMPKGFVQGDYAAPQVANDRYVAQPAASGGFAAPRVEPEYGSSEEYTAQVEPGGFVAPQVKSSGGKYKTLSNPSSPPQDEPKEGDVEERTLPSGKAQQWKYNGTTWEPITLPYDPVRPPAGAPPRDAAAQAADAAQADAAKRNAETAAKNAETAARNAANDALKTPAEIARLEAEAARLRAEADRIAKLAPAELAKVAAETDRTVKLLPHEINTMIANMGLTNEQAARIKALLPGEMSIQGATVDQIRASITNAAAQMGLDTSKFDWQRLTDSAKLTQSGQQQEMERAKQLEDLALARDRLKLDADKVYSDSERADLLAGGQMAGITGYYGGEATLDRERFAADADRANMLAQADVADRAAQIALKQGDQQEAQRQFNLSQQLRQQAQDSSERQFGQTFGEGQRQFDATFGLQQQTQLGSLDLERARFEAEQRRNPASFLDIAYAQRGLAPQVQAPSPFSFTAPTVPQVQTGVPAAAAAQGWAAPQVQANAMQAPQVAAGMKAPTVGGNSGGAAFAHTGMVAPMVEDGGTADFAFGDAGYQAPQVRSEAEEFRFGDAGKAAGQAPTVAPQSVGGYTAPQVKPLTFGDVEGSGALPPGSARRRNFAA